MDSKCKNCAEGFEVSDEDLRFYDRVSPTFDGKKFEIPVPTFCPDCRLQRRLVWRNERALYKRKCDLTGESFVSWISPTRLIKMRPGGAISGMHLIMEGILIFRDRFLSNLMNL